MENKLTVKYERIFPLLTESQRRLVAASDAEFLGHGGIVAVSKASGMSRSSITIGMKELQSGIFLDSGRNRRKGGGVVVFARAAYSHSASVGNRHPTNLANSAASYQETLVAGIFPRPNLDPDFLLPVALQNKSNCSKVTQYLLILKALSFT